MPVLEKVQFLLDENVSHRLNLLFNRFNIKFSTVQAHGWSGYKNSELAQQVKQNNYILLTRDRDFIFLWNKYQIKVIYLNIHPPVLDDLIIGLENLFNNWIYDLDKPFLIIVQKDSIRSWS